MERTTDNYEPFAKPADQATTTHGRIVLSTQKSSQLRPPDDRSGAGPREAAARAVEPNAAHLKTSARLNVLLVGEESAGIETLRMLAASEHHIAGVLAHQPDESSSATLWNAANRMGYKTSPAELVKSANFASEVERLQVDLLLNVHSLYIIDAALLSACRIGAFNLHPGPLPHYAGLNVPSWAIYNGETEHAVTLHEMVPQIDAGKIVYEQQVAIDRRDTGLTLSLKAVRAGVPLIAKLIAAASVSPETIPRQNQDLSSRRYFDAGPPNGGCLSWNRSAIDVVNQVRASDFAPFVSPWGHPKTSVNGTEIGITAADLTNGSTSSKPGTVGETLDGGILVAAADEWVLVRQVNVDGRRTSPLESLCPGDRLCEESS